MRVYAYVCVWMQMNRDTEPSSFRIEWTLSMCFSSSSVTLPPSCSANSRSYHHEGEWGRQKKLGKSHFHTSELGIYAQTMHMHVCWDVADGMDACQPRQKSSAIECNRLASGPGVFPNGGKRAVLVCVSGNIVVVECVALLQ